MRESQTLTNSILRSDQWLSRPAPWSSHNGFLHFLNAATQNKADDAQNRYGEKEKPAQ
jgi:hypothetical protein